MARIRANEVRLLQEFQFTANTPDGERATTIAGGAALVGVMLLMFLVFDVLFVGLLPNRVLLWIIIVVPGLVAFSVVVRRMQKRTLGAYSLRLDGRHLTVVCPNMTVFDLGEVQRVVLDRQSSDNKCADLAIAGSKDQIKLRLRTATAWNGKSKEKDFIQLSKAAQAIQDALIA